VATGFSGTGMTWGTLSAMILSDLILGRQNPYAALYDATRVPTSW
jgi:glycine/D-amino acid oxidase-like deaminating enzyme